MTRSRRLLLVLALSFSPALGCSIPDRAPIEDQTEDGGIADHSVADAPRDRSVTDTSTEGAPIDVRPIDGNPADLVRDTIADVNPGDPRDAPPTGERDVIDERPTSCVPGVACVPADPCHIGETTCSASGGSSCRDTMRPQTNGTTCDKGVCLSGACQTCAAGSSCEVPNKPCRAGTIACATGASVCTESDNKANGTACGTGMVCQEGTCKACVAGEACTPANPCHTGTLSCTGGTPTCADKGTNVAAGASCGKDKVCSATGSCDACTTGAPCTIAGNVCRTGTTACNTGAPVCIESADAPNGTTCGADRVCNAGMCVACTMGLSCTPANPCHAGTTVCSPTVQCVDTGASVANGTGCGADKVCSAGVCSACAEGKACQTTNACKVGTISCGTGVPKCDESGNQPNGTSCGTNQVCSNGVCGACSEGASCTPSNPCRTGTLSCATGSPICNDNSANLPNGTACGNNSVCRDGSCMACTAGAICQPTDVCKTGSTSCATGSSVCVASGNKAAGTSCGNTQSCSGGKTTAAQVCNSAGQCPAPAVTTCSTGTCNSSGTDCLTCGAGQTSCNGMCCAAGQACCNNACTALDTTAHCGSCTTACTAGQACNANRVCEAQTWCKTQSIPSGVAANDYACMDFDSGTFPPAGWTQRIVGPSTLEKWSAAFSLPSGMRSNTQLDGANTARGRATFDWTNATAGTSPVKSITVKGQINPFTPQRSAPWPDSVDILCVALSSNTQSYACLSYTYGSPRDWVANYTGFFIRSEIVTDTVVMNQCPVGGTFVSNDWSSAELTMTAATGKVDVTFNGTKSSCTSVLPPYSSSTPLVWVGTKAEEYRAPEDDIGGMSVTYDNVVVIVKR